MTAAASAAARILFIILAVPSVNVATSLLIK
jgi:hypothetical protein